MYENSVTMHIFVKILKGKDFQVTVSPGHTVMELKEILAMQVSIPLEEQKLVFKGKTLADDKSLSDYKINNGDKLFLLMKKGETPSQSPAVTVFPAELLDSKTVFWEKLRVFLQRHFTQQDSEKVLMEFMKDYRKRVGSLSLDDIERLAATVLHKNDRNFQEVMT